MQKKSGLMQVVVAGCCLLGGALVAVDGFGQSPPSPAAPAPSATPQPSPATVPLAEIADQSQKTIAALNAIAPEDADNKSLGVLRQAHQSLVERISLLQADSVKAGSAQSSLETLRNLQAGWRNLKNDLNEQGGALNQRAKALDEESARAQQAEKLWRETSKSVKEASAPPQTAQLVEDTLRAVDAAKKRVQSCQQTILALQSEVSETAAKAGAAQGTIEQAIANALKTLFVRDNLPLWDAQVQLNHSTATQHPESFKEQGAALSAYASGRGGLFALHGVIIAALLGGMLWLRRGLHRWTEEEPGLKRAAPVFDAPIAAAVALSFVVKGPIYVDAPNLFRALLGAAALLPTVVLLRRLLNRRAYPLLSSMMGFYFVDQLRLAASAYPILNRWIFSGEMLAAMLAFGWLISIQKKAEPTGRFIVDKLMPFFSRLGLALLIAATAANALGYERLGVLAGSAALRGAYAAVFLYALVRVLEGLVFIALRVRPLSASHIARQHREMVQEWVYQVLRLAALAMWLFLTLNFFQLRAPIFQGIERAMTFAIPLGAHRMTVGKLLSFALAIWLSVLVSRLARFFLDEEVYERIRLPAGLPYAVSTMVNYAVLLVGFLVALSLLGVDLTKVTIVAGAFSVGLGFGLQNIINNFVSGIILLFERPVKVGDVIQIAEAVGEVRRIGIRASVIRTRDGSDVIVPNGNLISNQVTNWTYSDRRRAVEIPLSIALGPDPNHVMELLKAAVVSQCSAQNDPEPQVYITGIVSGNLNLVVRAWTSRYEDWIEARSELFVALAASLTREDIRLT